MIRHNARNERIKREYFRFLADAKGASEAKVAAAGAALHRFERSTRFRDFRTFRREQAISFKVRFRDEVNPRNGEPLAKATLYATLKELRLFFQWLAREPGCKVLTYSDADYFNLSANDVRVAKAERTPPTPSLDQVLHLIDRMPSTTLVERRNRAVVAFTILSGARDGAIASMSLKHVDVAKGFVFQDAREVKTKRRKTFRSTFFPVGERPREIVVEWVAELESLLYGPDDPLFPATLVAPDAEGGFAAQGLTRGGWSSADPVRAIFRRAFDGAGLPRFPPHSFRRTLMQLAYELDLTHKQMKAWSQNLGHDRLLTTLTSYGNLLADDQAVVMSQLQCRRANDTDEDVGRALAVLQKRLGRME
jgi:integrase